MEPSIEEQKRMDSIDLTGPNATWGPTMVSVKLDEWQQIKCLLRALTVSLSKGHPIVPHSGAHHAIRDLLKQLEGDES